MGASGGIWFGDSSVAPVFRGLLNTSTGGYLSHTGVWTNAADRTLKEQFEPIDGRALLDQLARLPITRGAREAARSIRHRAA